MTDTIFVPSFGNRPRNLVGREDVLRDFELSMGSPVGSKERALVLLGQRGSGKTVLLLELAEMASRKDFVVASPTVVSKDMPERIIEKLNVAGAALLSRDKAVITGGSVNILGFGAGVQLQGADRKDPSFSMLLTELCHQFNEKGKRVLILVDEVQANHEELRKLIISYQEMVGLGIDVSIVLAGLPATISNVLNDHVLTFLNRATKIYLSPLRGNDIAAYYASSFAELGATIDSALIENAARETAGSPYLMQLIGHYIVLLADNQKMITQSVYQEALEKAKTDFKNDICQTTLAPLSDRDVDFLMTMAQDEDMSDISAIADRLGTTGAYAQTYKRRLIQSGIIEQPRRGKVRFAVPYLKDYLLEHEE